MRTNKKTRKTMPQSWIDFFNYAQEHKFGKYFDDDGYQCCAYSPEHDPRRVVQTAVRRSWGRHSSYLSKDDKEKASRILGKDNFILEIVYVTCSPLHGGVYIYDFVTMRKNGYMLDNQIVDRNGHPYYEVPLDYCKKTCDIWDIPKRFGGKTLYKMARWQYEHLMQQNAYDNIDTWEDLPDWVFWKYFEYDGSIIPGREEAAKEYIEKCKKDARYIPLWNEEVCVNN